MTISTPRRHAWLWGFPHDPSICQFLSRSRKILGTGGPETIPVLVLAYRHGTRMGDSAAVASGALGTGMCGEVGNQVSAAVLAGLVEDGFQMVLDGVLRDVQRVDDDPG